MGYIQRRTLHEEPGAVDLGDDVLAFLDPLERCRLGLEPRRAPARRSRDRAPRPLGARYSDAQRSMFGTIRGGLVIARAA